MSELKTSNEIKYVFFGSSRFSELVLAELEKSSLSPLLKISSAKKPLPTLEELRGLDADVFIVASFGKILPRELLDIPKFGSLNIHPSLLPKLRGPAPIQNTILSLGQPGVTIIKMDEHMDHGPILAQEPLTLAPWPDHYAAVEEKLARAGGKLLLKILPNWINGKLETRTQDESSATYVKMIKKEDGLLDLSGDAEANLRIVMAYSTWPGAHFIFKNKFGKDIRIAVKDAKIIDGKFIPTRIVPDSKREMAWDDFLRGNN